MPIAEFGVGVIGMGWMGETHSRAYSQVQDRFWNTQVRPRLVICADAELERAEQARSRFGFDCSVRDWREVVSHPAVDIVSIAAPNAMHLTMAEAAAQAGKHVYCEKPVGRSFDETRRIARAVADAGVNSCVGFNYRWAPLVQYARQLIEEGRLGSLTHFRSRFFSMYGHNPLSQLSWRFQREQAGLGSLGDLLSHVIDMALHLAGPIERTVGLNHTFIPRRPLPTPGEGTHFSLGTPADPHGEVTNEDFVAVLAEFSNGARGVLEGCRVMYGPKCEFAFDWHGTDGAARWDFQRMNEIDIYSPDEKQCIGEKPDPHDGFARVLAGPEHPDFHWFQPGAGISLGYDDLKTLEVFHFLRSIAEGRPHEPGVAQALRVAQIQKAVQRSWQSGLWIEVDGEEA